MEFKNEQKNLVIELLRIYFTFAVCLHHFRLYSSEFPYGGGYLAVDFFFMISGFYLLKHYEKRDVDNTHGKIGRYVLERYRRLFLDYFLAFLVALILRYCFFRETINGFIGGYFREAFMIEFCCLHISERINPPDWYCGYLLLASVFLYFIISYLRKYINMGYYFAISVVLYIYLRYHSNNLNLYPQMQAVFSIAIIRALAGMFMGCFVYSASCYLKTRFNNKKVMWIFSGCLLGMISYIILWDNSFPDADYIAIILFVILFLMISQMNIDLKSGFVRKSIEFAGTNSYIVYLNHYIVAVFFARDSWFRNLDWKIISLLYLGAVVLFSLIMVKIKMCILKGTGRK